MSDTAEDTTDTGDQTDAGQSQNNDKPAGYDPIDPASATPEQVQERLDYLYRQVKDYGRTSKETNRTLEEYRQIAQSQSQQIEELTTATSRVVDHLQDRSNKDTEASIKAEMQRAFDAGDNVAYVDAQAKLIDLKARQNAPKPVQQKPQQQYTSPKQSASQMASEGVSDGELSQQDAKYVEQWQNETDDSGSPLRPWANNTSEDPEDPDPDFIKGVLIAKKVWQQYPQMTAAQKLAEVDKRMGVKQRAGGQTVMGGRLTNGGKQSKLTLTAKQQEIAVRTKFGGSKAKTDAEHMDAYRKQLEKVKGTR